jgi:hypothetical protein
MLIRRYLDEDAMDSDLVRALRLRGVDVTTALDVGLIGSADEAHLKFAIASERTLIPSMLATSWPFIRRIWRRGNRTPESFSLSNNAIALGSRCDDWFV